MLRSLLWLGAGVQVHLLVRGRRMRASAAMQDRVLSHEKVEVHYRTAVRDAYGDKKGMKGLLLYDTETGAPPPPCNAQCACMHSLVRPPCNAQRACMHSTHAPPLQRAVRMHALASAPPLQRAVRTHALPFAPPQLT